MSSYAFTRSRIFQWMGILLSLGIIAVGYWWYQSQASTLNKSPTGSITSGLVGYWTFDASSTTSSTATDQGSGGNNGILQNSPQQTEGKNGQGLDFFPNGSDNNSRMYIEDPVDGDLDFGSGNFSVGFWLKSRGYSSQTSSANVILTKKTTDTGTSAGYAFQINSSNIFSFSVGNGSSSVSVSTPSAIDDSQWHYYVGLRSGDTTYLYQDGVLLGTNTITGSTSNSNRFVVGSDDAGTNGNTRNTNGIIDEVRVYNAALTVAQIQSLYQLGASDRVNSSVSQPQGSGRLDSGLALYYPLDDGSGTNADDPSTNGNDGTLTGAGGLPTWTTGQIGGAVDFDGTDDYITVADSDALDIANTENFTLTGWFNRDTFAADHTIVAKRSGILNTDDGYIIFIDDATDQLVFEVSESSGSDEYGLLSDSTFTASGWHHFAVVWDDAASGQTTIYIDGVPETPATSGTFTNVASLENAVAFTVGAESDAGNPFDGKIDEIRLYHRALPAEDVDYLYRTTTPTGIDAGLDGYWSLNAQDMSNITTVYDRSGSGVHLAMNNTPTLIEGQLGQGVDFDGSFETLTSGADIAAYDVGDTDDLVIAAWFSRKSSDTEDAIVTKRNNSGSVGYSLWIDDTDDMMYFELHDGTDEYQLKSVQTFTDTGWHHVVAVWDQDSASNSKIYIDGIEASVTKTGTIGNIGDLSNTTNLLVGGHSGATSSNCYCKLDEIRLYKRILAAGEVAALYAAGQKDGWNSSASQLQGTGRLDSGLLGYWALDDGSGGTAADSTANAFNGTLANEAAWTTGQIGGAVSFDGSNDYISASHTTTLNAYPITISTWFKTTVNDATRRALVGKYTNLNGYIMYVKNGVVKGWYILDASNYVYDGSDGMATTTTVNDDAWHLATMTIDAGGGKLYLDGKQEASRSWTGTAGPITNTRGLFWANYEYTGTGYLASTIDETRIYNRALSADEVSQLYRLSSPTGVDTSLKGYWSFNGQDVSGTTAYDRSGVENTGTLTSGPAVAEGRIGQGIDFDGTDDYVSVADSATLDAGDTDDLTITGWFYRDSSSTDDTVVAKRNGITSTDTGYIVYVDDSDDKLYFEVSDGTDEYQLTSTSTFTTSGWNHFAIVWDQDSASASEIYINGAANGATDTGTIGNIGNLSNSVVLAHGAESDAGNPFDGKLDEIRVYKTVLSVAQIAALYNSSR